MKALSILPESIWKLSMYPLLPNEYVDSSQHIYPQAKDTVRACNIVHCMRVL